MTIVVDRPKRDRTTNKPQHTTKVIDMDQLASLMKDLPPSQRNEFMIKIQNNDMAGAMSILSNSPPQSSSITQYNKEDDLVRDLQNAKQRFEDEKRKKPCRLELPPAQIIIDAWNRKRVDMHKGNILKSFCGEEKTFSGKDIKDLTRSE